MPDAQPFPIPESALFEIAARSEKRDALADWDSLANYSQRLEADRDRLLAAYRAAAPLISRLREAAAPLAAIFEVWRADGLDEDRPDWRDRGIGGRPSFENVELFSGRGGKRLLTLADAERAWEALGNPLTGVPTFEIASADVDAALTSAEDAVATMNFGALWEATIDDAAWEAKLRRMLATLRPETKGMISLDELRTILFLAVDRFEQARTVRKLRAHQKEIIAGWSTQYEEMRNQAVASAVEADRLRKRVERLDDLRVAVDEFGFCVGAELGFDQAAFVEEKQKEFFAMRDELARLRASAVEPPEGCPAVGSTVTAKIEGNPKPFLKVIVLGYSPDGTYVFLRRPSHRPFAALVTETAFAPFAVAGMPVPKIVTAHNPDLAARGVVKAPWAAYRERSVDGSPIGWGSTEAEAIAALEAAEAAS